MSAAEAPSPERIRFGDPQAPPRLALGHSHWALHGLADAPEAYLPRLVEDGFEALEVNATDGPPAIAAAAADAGLALIAQGLCLDADATAPVIEAAVAIGAVAVNIQLGHAFLAPADAAAIVRAVRARADDAGLLVLFETHRGRLTQDLVRTAELIAREPDVRFTLDLSHYWVGNEGTGNDAARFKELLRPVLDRTLLVHGRVSDGEVVQADIGARGDAGSVPIFVNQWSKAMAAWQAVAGPGDVFVFEPELGPWPYAPLDEAGVEVTDRWTRSLVMADLGRQAWARATAYVAERSAG